MDLAGLLALLLSTQDPAVAYRGARVYPGDGPALDRATLVVRGRVVEVLGPDVPLPEGAKVVELEGKTILPGLIDAASRGFLDPADRGPGGPEQDVADALDFFRDDALEARARGVTTLYVMPDVGLGAVVHLGAKPEILRRSAALHLSLARSGEVSTPSGRHDAYRQATALFEGARSYKEAWDKYRKDKKDVDAKKAAGEKGLKDPVKPARDPAKEALVRALDGELPLRVEAHAADSIDYALRLAEEFKLRLVLQGATEAFERAERLSTSKAALIVGPVLRYGPPSAETLRHTSGCAAALARAGVAPLAIGSFGRDAGASRFLLDAAGAAVAAGLPRERAIEALTGAAARALGLDAEIGALRKGRRADFIVLSGDPFDPRSRVERTYVDGVLVHGKEGGP